MLNVRGSEAENGAYAPFLNRGRLRISLLSTKVRTGAAWCSLRRRLATQQTGKHPGGCLNQATDRWPPNCSVSTEVCTGGLDRGSVRRKLGYNRKCPVLRMAGISRRFLVGKAVFRKGTGSTLSHIHIIKVLRLFSSYPAYSPVRERLQSCGPSLASRSGCCFF